ncbi:MAG: YihY/virulence factor BrkB family protein [Rickettsiaceae bacterium]|nr:MAG: YihY/virulence factor BrkB family protein [Rickettsiaceae bacterium]
MKKVAKSLYTAAVKTIEHDGVEHSGYMSFMVLLSIFPFLIFFVALTSFLGASELGDNFIKILMENMPERTTESIKIRINELGRTPPQSLMNLAIVGSIWTASSFVECLRTILNRVHGVTSPPSYIIRRLLSIVQFLFISLMIGIAMLILVVTPLAFTKIPIITKTIAGYEKLLNICRYILILSATFLGVSSLYYIIPNIKLKFRNIIPGALLTVLLWVISGHLLSKYIMYYNQLNVIYGSLGSIIVTLVFFYLTNMIFIYGAEFNHALIIDKKHDLSEDVFNNKLS